MHHPSLSFTFFLQSDGVMSPPILCGIVLFWAGQGSLFKSVDECTHTGSSLITAKSLTIKRVMYTFWIPHHILFFDLIKRVEIRSQGGNRPRHCEQWADKLLMYLAYKWVEAVWSFSSVHCKKKKLFSIESSWGSIKISHNFVTTTKMNKYMSGCPLFLPEKKAQKGEIGK